MFSQRRLPDVHDFARETLLLARHYPGYDLDELRSVVLDITHGTLFDVNQVLSLMRWWLAQGIELRTVRAWYLNPGSESRR